MKGGTTAHIRISPADCLSTLDVLQGAGIDTTGMSFAACVSLAYSSLLGMARKAQLIEEPDTFQYLNRMQPYLGTGNNKKKHDITSNLYERSMRGGAAVTLPPVRASMPPQVMEEQALRELKDRFTKLNDRKEADIPLSLEEEQEWQVCFSVLYPDG